MRTLDDVIQRMSIGAYSCVNTLTDNDRVVDNDTQHDDKSKQTHHVDRYRPGPVGHQRHRTQKRDRNSDHDPHGNFHTQEHGQHDENQ